MVGFLLAIDLRFDMMRFLSNWLYSEVEITSGLTCFCLPVFPQLYRQQIKKLFSAPRHPSTYSHSDTIITPSFHVSQFNATQGGLEPISTACGRLSWSKDHYINLDESIDHKSKQADFFKPFDIDRVATNLSVPS